MPRVSGQPINNKTGHIHNSVIEMDKQSNIVCLFWTISECPINETIICNNTKKSEHYRPFTPITNIFYVPHNNILGSTPNHKCTLQYTIMVTNQSRLEIINVKNFDWSSLYHRHIQHCLWLMFILDY